MTKTTHFLLIILSTTLIFSCTNLDPLEEISISTQNLKEKSLQNNSIQAVDYRTVKDPKVLIQSDASRSFVCDYSNIDFDLFRLTYIAPSGSWESQCYDRKELATALIQAGQSIQDAHDRTNRIFRTAYTSGQYLGETAGIIGPTEVIAASNNYTANISRFLDNGSCLQGCIPSYGPQGPIPDDESCIDGEIRTASYYKGVSGNVLYAISNRANIALESVCDPNFFIEIDFELDDIRNALPQADWENLLTGNLTEREFWNLYQHRLVPTLLQGSTEVDINDPCLILETAYFRANYLANGTFAHFIGYVRGSGRINCTNLPQLPG